MYEAGTFSFVQYRIIFSNSQKANLFFLSAGWWKPWSRLKSWGVQLLSSRPFTLLLMLSFTVSLRLRLKEKREGGFKREGKVFFPLCYSFPFLLCTAPNGSFTSRRNLLHSYSPRKLVLCVCDLCVTDAQVHTYDTETEKEDVFRFHIIKFTTIKSAIWCFTQYDDYIVRSH